jgi:PST family polysaccharide transporter
MRSNLLGLVWMFTGRGVLSVAQLAAIMVLARLLGREEFGAATVVVLLGQLSVWVATCGLGPALVQRGRIEPVHANTALLVAGVGGLGFGAALLALRPALGWFFNLGDHAPLLTWLVVLCPLAALHQVSHSLMQRGQRFRTISATETLSYLGGSAALAIGLAWSGAGATALVAGQAANYAGMLVTYLIVLRPRPCDGLAASAFRELARTGVGFGLAELAGWGAQNLDKLLVGRLLGVGAVGVYSRAYALMQSLTNLLTYPLDAVLFAAFSRAQDDAARLRDLFVKSNLLVALLCLPPAVVLVAAPGAIVRVLLGAPWLEAAPVLRIFGIFLFFRVVYRVTDFVLRARGLVFQRLAIIVGLCGLAAVAVTVGARWGLPGVALGMSACFGFTFLALAWLALPLVKVSWRAYLGLFVPPWVFGALLAWAAATTTRHVAAAWPPWLTLMTLGLLVAGTLAALTVLAPAVVFGAHGRKVRGLLHDLRGEWRRRAPGA